MSAPNNVPVTSHNQKRQAGEGPVPNLVSALRTDNRDQLMSVLSLDPLSNESTALLTAPEPLSSNASSAAPVSHRQRLIFATESLRTLLIYHTLPDPSTRSATHLNKKKLGNPRSKQALTHEELSLGLIHNNPHGIVGTRILFPNGMENLTTNETSIAATASGSAQGTEAIYNPASSVSAFDSGLEPHRDDDRASVIVYFIQPYASHVRAVCKTIQAYDKHNPSVPNPFDSGSSAYTRIVKHRIVFLPRVNTLATQILADENIISRKDVSVHTLEIDLVPIEDDVLTLLDLNVTKDINVSGMPSNHVTCIASSILKIQNVCGIIPRIQSYGPLGEMTVSALMSLRLEEYDPYEEEENENDDEKIDMKDSDFQAMIVLDRRVDLVTPLLTPLTYEGLLDDVLKIESGIIKVDTNIIDPPDEASATGSTNTGSASGKQQERPKYTYLPLNDLDTLYVEVRDQHVEKFGSFLQEQAKALKESHANFSDKNKDLTEIHQFVKQIPIFTQNLKSLTNHIHLAELIKYETEQSEFRQRWQTERSMVESETCYDTIEDLIASQYPVWRILRLLCLQSITSGGLKVNKFDSLRREIVQTYGYEFVFVLQNLEKVGLIRKKESLWDTASPFTSLRKHLKLIQADVDPLNPDDVSYVSSGFAPISARIIQTSLRGWGGKEEALKDIPGRLIDILQKSTPEEFKTALKNKVGSTLGSWAKQVGEGKKKKPVMLIYFIGGITYAEIAAFRFMSKRTSFPFTIVCCTTKIINGSSFLQSLS
mmetsp:Transcript_15301/g.18619  ORF Transcript_15301/g.18619 Transcript_15301/m.18619 type:complete len:768 (-) Transcript_15301:112-2415(-)